MVENLIFQRFMHMGGYAYYVWPAYLLVAVVVSGNVLKAYLERQQVFKRLQKYYDAQA